MNLLNLQTTFLLSVEKNLPLVSSQIVTDEVSLIVNNQNLLFSLNVLKKHINYQYSLLSCISGVDLLNSNYRFLVVYDLLSVKHNNRIRVKVFVNEITSIESSMSVFINANWWEREVWDMYGVYFQNHPDLRRILSDYGFEGYPLRKDFPLSGFFEVRYDLPKKRIVLNNLELTQEFRHFVYDTAW